MTTMYRLMIALIFLMATATFSGAAEKQTETRPKSSITHGKTGIAYMGSADVNAYFLGMSIRTSHGVIFTDCNVFLGGSLEGSFGMDGTAIKLSAYSKWYYPRAGKVQGFIGLEAGGIYTFEGKTFGNNEPETIPAYIIPNINPALGFSVNFKKVSLEIAMRFNTLSQVIFNGSNVWYPGLSLGISF